MIKVNFFNNRNKYHAVRTTVDGINFASLSEASFYQDLKLDPSVVHIDCHVPVTLPGGLRLNIDFVVYRSGKDGTLDTVEAVEVKGFSTESFRRMRKLFNATHPLSPLLVYKKQGKKWIAI